VVVSLTDWTHHNPNFSLYEISYLLIFSPFFKKKAPSGKNLSVLTGALWFFAYRTSLNTNMAVAVTAIPTITPTKKIPRIIASPPFSNRFFLLSSRHKPLSQRLMPNLPIIPIQILHKSFASSFARSGAIQLLIVTPNKKGTERGEILSTVRCQTLAFY